MQYDDIIVGAGSSVAALAARLSEGANRSVLLLEVACCSPLVEISGHRGSCDHRKWPRRGSRGRGPRGAGLPRLARSRRNRADHQTERQAPSGRDAQRLQWCVTRSSTGLGSPRYAIRRGKTYYTVLRGRGHSYAAPSAPSAIRLLRVLIACSKTTRSTTLQNAALDRHLHPWRKSR